MSELTGILPGGRAAATLGAGLLGPAIATYTAALICDTAVPAWHEGYREMPYVFAGSAASAAGGLGLLAVRPADAGPARDLAVLGAAVELIAKRAGCWPASASSPSPTRPGRRARSSGWPSS